MMPAHARRDFAQEGLVVGLQGHVSMGLDHPGGGLAFRDAVGEVNMISHRNAISY